MFEEKTVMVQLGMTVGCDPSHWCKPCVLVRQPNPCYKIESPMTVALPIKSISSSHRYTAPYGLYHKIFLIRGDYKCQFTFENKDMDLYYRNKAIWRQDSKNSRL